MSVKHNIAMTTCLDSCYMMKKKNIFTQWFQEAQPILADLFRLQQLHWLSLLLIKGNIGVEWELCWKGKALIRGSRHIWEISWDFGFQNFRMTHSIFHELWNALEPLVVTAREPVPIDKCIIWPVNAGGKVLLLQHTIAFSHQLKYH